MNSNSGGGATWEYDRHYSFARLAALLRSSGLCSLFAHALIVRKVHFLPAADEAQILLLLFLARDVARGRALNALAEILKNSVAKHTYTIKVL